MMAHVLLVNQFFTPDPAPTGQLLADLAMVLMADGHIVTVVCGDSSYKSKLDKTTCGLPAELTPALTVVRLRSAPFSRGFAGRLFSYTSFFVQAITAALQAGQPDVVVTLTTPPLVSWAGLAVQKCRGARHYIWEMDVYPDVAVGVGMLGQTSLVTRTLGWLADFPRKRADGIIALGECMRQLLTGRGMPPERIQVVENWANGESIQPRPWHRDGSLRVLYSGNLGLAHDVDTICRAMASLNHEPRIQFQFSGGGAKQSELLRFCQTARLRNLAFLPFAPADTLSEQLGGCDIGLVTQNPRCLGAVVPSKVYGLMAAGRPYLFVGPAAATPGRIIERHGCGWHVEVDRPEEVAELLLKLRRHPELVEEAGRRGRQAFEASYDRPMAVTRLRAALHLDPAERQLARAAAAASG